MFYISLRDKTWTFISFLTADDVAFPNGICKEEYLMNLMSGFFYFFFFLLTLLKNIRPYR